MALSMKFSFKAVVQAPPSIHSKTFAGKVFNKG